MSFAEGYNDVAARLVEFRAKWPDGSLRPVNPDEPIKIRVIGDRMFLEYVAEARRSADDKYPGIGTAWEPFPGKTPYTKDSEAMVAETSAWGRAIVASLAADTKKGVASADEVRNREAERDEENTDPRSKLRAQIAATARDTRQWSATDTAGDFASWSTGVTITDADAQLLRKYLTYLRAAA